MEKYDSNSLVFAQRTEEVLRRSEKTISEDVRAKLSSESLSLRQRKEGYPLGYPSFRLRGNFTRLLQNHRKDAILNCVVALERQQKEETWRQ